MKPENAPKKLREVVGVHVIKISSRTLGCFISLMFAGLLGACGGGGSGTSTPAPAPVPVPIASAISVSSSLTSVASDNSNSATITATVVNASNAAVSGVPVTFSADSGFLSASSGVSDASGKATVTFSSGTSNASTRTATIVASASGQTAQIPVRITGSTLTLTTTSSSLVVGGSTATLTVTAKNSAGTVLAGQTITLTQSTNGIVTLSPISGTTDASGNFTSIVTPIAGGLVTITATGVGETRTIVLTVTGASTAFQITTPAAAPTPTPATINTPVTVSVRVPAPTTSVTFVTTLGTWLESGRSVYTPPSIAGGTASATLSSASAGVANIQVFDTARQSTINDSRVVSFTASCTSASKVTLQSSPSVVAPSSGGTSSLSTLLVTVTDGATPVANPVGGCPVAFRIVNSTGGGETITPAVVLTSSVPGGSSGLGQATATFTAGSLPSGANGVQIRATVVQDPALPVVSTGTPPSGSDATVVIGGTAGSVTIGRASVATDSGNGTLYVLPMSVLIADSNGNPVANTVVSLSTWPIAFNVGGTVCVNNAPPGLPGTYYFNEDVNENLILEQNEDGVRKLYPSGVLSAPGPANLQLTPPNSASGTLPATVTTASNGVATFNLTYTKSNALWIIDRIRARTLVQGTETLGEVRFALPALVSDIQACLLPPSPY